MPLGAGPALEQLKKTVRLVIVGRHIQALRFTYFSTFKRLQADRLVEEQQSNRTATESYVSTSVGPRIPYSFCQFQTTQLLLGLCLQRLKLQEAQSQLSSLQQAYTREKTENTQLKAKIKDGDAVQIPLRQLLHVTCSTRSI